jgi:hypothetical protein
MISTSATKTTVRNARGGSLAASRVNENEVARAL